MTRGTTPFEDDAQEALTVPGSNPDPPSDAQRKAEHAVRMMHAAQLLATLAPSTRQARILGRYVVLHADSAARWIAHWSDNVGNRAQNAKREMKLFRQRFVRAKQIRDKLAAKRQAADPRHSADARTILRLWSSLNAQEMRNLCEAAAATMAALGSTRDFSIQPDADTVAKLYDALSNARLDASVVYTDATSYCVGEPFLLAIADSGPRGRRVVAINDVAEHLELLYVLRSAAKPTDDLGLVLRSAMIAELCELLELVVGPITGRRGQVPLAELVPHDPNVDAENPLALIRGETFEQFRHWLRFARDKAAVHLDTQLSYEQILEVLREASPDQLMWTADEVIQVLDLAARHHVLLRLLVLGARPLGGIAPAARRSLPAAMESDENIAVLDGDFVVWTAGGFAQPTNARIAGVIAGRPGVPRERWYTVPPG